MQNQHFVLLSHIKSFSSANHCKAFRLLWSSYWKWLFTAVTKGAERFGVIEANWFYIPNIHLTTTISYHRVLPRLLVTHNRYHSHITISLHIPPILSCFHYSSSLIAFVPPGSTVAIILINGSQSVCMKLCEETDCWAWTTLTLPLP